MSLGTVSLVGSPSSGKSTLFNRFVGERKSIVEPTPGVTRDRIYGKCTWLTKTFTVIDTGGIQAKEVPFQDLIRAQVDLALEESDLILFVVDGKKGLTGDDRYIAKMLYGKKKPIYLVVNKVDNVEESANAMEFYSLGLGDPYIVSGAHGIGIGDLLDAIIHTLPEKEIPTYGDAITFSLIGRPNVGKSSLSNKLLGKERTLVSPISGTTRDAIDTAFAWNNQNFVLIDTAGLLKRGKIYEAIDKYAAMRALASIERSQIVLFLLDASMPISEQDKHVVGYAVDEHKPIIVIVNKWDLAKEKGLNKDEFTKSIRDQFKFLDYAPILYISAASGSGVEQVLPKVLAVHEASLRRVPTPLLNEIIRDAQAMNPAPNFNHGRLKIIFSNQVSVNPPTFVFFCNNPETAHFSYTRYLENRLRASFDFDGTPIHIIYRLRK